MKKNLSKSMAILRLTVSLIWIALSIGAMVYVNKAVQEAEDCLGERLPPVIESIGTAHSILLESSDVLIEVEESLDSVQDVAVDVTLLLTDTRPLVAETTQVIASDVPEAIEGVQASMPSLIETAATVDETLRFLSAFEMSIPLPFREALSFGLGVSYNPEVPLDQALEELNGNLDGIPENLYGLEDDLETANVNLLVVRDDLAALSDDLYEINRQMKDINPQLDALTKDVQTLHTSMKQVEDLLITILPMVRTVLIVFFALVLAGQLPLLYMAVLVLRGDVFQGQD